MNKARISGKRRKLLKSIAAGSGAVIAGKNLPESWTRPVVDAVLLPAHAQTSACSTINITFVMTVSGISDGGSGYDISQNGNPVDGDGGPFGVSDGSYDFTISRTYGPGQYLVSAGLGISGTGSATATITVSCCTGASVAIVDASLSGDESANGCALVTLADDGSCSVEITTCT